MIFSNKGVISLIASFFIMVIGVALLVLARQLRLPSWVDEVSRYVISVGIFGLAGGDQLDCNRHANNQQAIYFLCPQGILLAATTNKLSN